jgi:hypothetical protein
MDPKAEVLANIESDVVLDCGIRDGSTETNAVRISIQYPFFSPTLSSPSYPLFSGQSCKRGRTFVDHPKRGMSTYNGKSTIHSIMEHYSW